MCVELFIVYSLIIILMFTEFIVIALALFLILVSTLYSLSVLLEVHQLY